MGFAKTQRKRFSRRQPLPKNALVNRNFRILNTFEFQVRARVQHPSSEEIRLRRFDGTATARLRISMISNPILIVPVSMDFLTSLWLVPRTPDVRAGYDPQKNL